jgi:hypothetical protein
MNEVSSEHPSKIYDDKTRAEIQKFVEMVAKRRKVSTDAVDFDALWKALENAARLHKGNLDHTGPQTTLRKTLDRLDGCIDAIRTLTGENGLLSPSLLSWSFISDNGFISKRESPAALAGLVRNLQKVEAELVEDAKTFRLIAKGKHPLMCSPDDHRHLLQWNMLGIGHYLLGPQIGDVDGPLMTFIQLVLRPVLGNATPGRTTIRTFARRMAKDGQPV